MWDCRFWWWVRALIFSLHRNLSLLFTAACCQFNRSSGVVALGFAVVFNNEQVSCLFSPWFYNRFTRVNAPDLRSPLSSVGLWGPPQWVKMWSINPWGQRTHKANPVFSAVWPEVAFVSRVLEVVSCRSVGADEGRCILVASQECRCQLPGFAWSFWMCQMGCCCLFLEMEVAHLAERSGRLERAEQWSVAAS